MLPVIFEDFVPNLLRNPRAMIRVANLARRADLRSELEELRASGLPITALWATRDGIIPRSRSRPCASPPASKAPSWKARIPGCWPILTSSAK